MRFMQTSQLWPAPAGLCGLCVVPAFQDLNVRTGVLDVLEDDDDGGEKKGGGKEGWWGRLLRPLTLLIEAPERAVKHPDVPRRGCLAAGYI